MNLTLTDTIYCNSVCTPGGNAQLLGTTTQPSFTSCIYYCNDSFALGFEAQYDVSNVQFRGYRGIQNSFQGKQPGQIRAIINGLGIQGGN